MQDSAKDLTKSSQGYFEPTINKYIILRAFQVQIRSLTSLDYTFAGLSQANVTADFKLETT